MFNIVKTFLKNVPYIIADPLLWLAPHSVHWTQQKDDELCLLSTEQGVSLPNITIGVRYTVGVIQKQNRQRIYVYQICFALVAGGIKKQLYSVLTKQSNWNAKTQKIKDDMGGGRNSPQIRKWTPIRRMHGSRKTIVLELCRPCCLLVNRQHNTNAGAPASI